MTPASRSQESIGTTRGGLYRVVAVGRHSESKETLVAYECLGTGEWWFRSPAMFFETVVVDGVSVRRFEPMGALG